MNETDSDLEDSDSDSEAMRAKYMKQRMEVDMKRRNLLLKLKIATLAGEVQESVGKGKNLKPKPKQFRKKEKPERSSIVLRPARRVRYYQEMNETDFDLEDSDSDSEAMRAKYMKERMEVDIKRRNLLLKLNIATLTGEVQESVGKKEKPERSPIVLRPASGVRYYQGKKKKLESSSRVSRSVEKPLEKSDPAGASKRSLPITEFAMIAVGFEQETPEDKKDKEDNKKLYDDYYNFMDSMQQRTQDVTEVLSPTLDEQAVSKEKVKRLSITRKCVQQITTRSVYSMAVQSSHSDLLVAAGDSFGNLGLWKPSRRDSNSGTYIFRASDHVISSLKFSPVNSNRLYYSSHSGQLRCLDFEKSVFEKVALDQDDRMCGFDFINPGFNIVAACGNQGITVYDTRQPKRKVVETLDARTAFTKCVSCHPTKEQYVLSSHQDGSVMLYDIRRMSQKGKLKEVFAISGHSKSVSSAYFSPMTGNTILTTCLDDKLRLFDSVNITKQDVKLRASCSHNNQTGRWLTPFRATWHPECEDLFVVGSLQRPRQIDIYDSHAKAFHLVQDWDIFTTVSSVNCFHKSNYLFAGNAGGRVFMFSSK